MTFAQVLNEHWRLIENDLRSEYQIEVRDEQLMRSMRWPWLRERILGLLSVDCRLTRALTPKPDRSEGVA